MTAGLLRIGGTLLLALGAMACGRASPAGAGGGLSGSRRATGASCADPIPLAFGRSLLDSTQQGGRALSASCTSGDAPERIYMFDLTQRSQLRVVLASQFDAALSLRQSCTYADSELSCNDDYPKGDSTQSRIEEILDPGRYYLIVDGATGDFGDFELFASSSPLASVEGACESALPLVAGSTVRGSTRGRPDLFHAACGRGAHAGEAVYRLEVDEPSRLRVIQQTEHDGVLHLRRRCEAPQTELSCNDDFRGSNYSLLTAQVEAGTYFLFSDGLSRPHAGTYSLRAELASLASVAPARTTLDALCEAAQALPLAPGIAELDTFSTPSRQQGSCCGALAPEVLYTFEVSERSRVWVRLRDPEFNAVLYLRERCTVPRSEVACERQARVDRRRSPGQPTPRGLNVIADPGLYYLFVDGAAEGDFGAAQLELAVTPVAELVERCASAPWLRGGDVIEGDTAGGDDGLRASCGGEARAAEHVYRLELERRSRLVLDLESGFDAVLHVRGACADVTTEVACNDDAAHDRSSQVDVVLDPGDYFVVVDGFGADEVGPYRLRVTTTTEPGSE